MPGGYGDNRVNRGKQGGYGADGAVARTWVRAAARDLHPGGVPGAHALLLLAAAGRHDAGRSHRAAVQTASHRQ